MSEGFQDPIPCPAGKCDAQIYNVKKENLIYCLKCGARNPNYCANTKTPQVSEGKQQPFFDPETGIIKW